MVLLPIRSNLINFFFVISHFFQSAADFLFFFFSNQENQSTGSKNESKFYITQFFFNSQGNSIFFLLSKKMRKTDKKCAINRGTIFSISQTANYFMCHYLRLRQFQKKYFTVLITDQHNIAVRSDTCFCAEIKCDLIQFIAVFYCS